jgi:hypothetical protein
MGERELFRQAFIDGQDTWMKGREAPEAARQRGKAQEEEIGTGDGRRLGSNGPASVVIPNVADRDVRQYGGHLL